MKIDVYSHSFMITEPSHIHRKVVDAYCRGLVQFEMVITEGVKSYRAAKVFASADVDRKYYRLHINALKQFLDHLAYNQIRESEYVIERHSFEVEERHRVTFKVKELPEPRDPQPKIIGHILAPGTNKIVTLQTGKGKALKADTPVRIPGGWQEIGLLNVDDEVIAHDGTVTKVLGVYPQGVTELYRVTFADGRFVEACPEHLWEVYYVNTVKHKRWRVVNTMEVLRLMSMPNPRVAVRLITPDEGSGVLPLTDPWMLGVLIGDGCLSANQVAVSTPDQFIVEKLRARLPYGIDIIHAANHDYRISQIGLSKKNGNQLINEMKELGLLGCKAEAKFIPKDYLEMSRANRLALIQGLMDTDGTVQKSGSLSYSTVSKQLAEDVQYLARSLGALACIRPRQTYYTYLGVKKAGQLCYEVDIRHSKPSEFLTLPRKLERTNDLGQYNQDLKLYIKTVVKVDDAESVCIAVEHPESLFVVKDFIVTHNTFLTKYSMNQLGLRSCFFMKGGFIERWVPDMEESFHFKGGDLLVVRGSKALSALMHMALEGDMRAKCIFISINTYSNYIKDFEAKGVTEDFPIAPGEFFSRLNIGMAALDEGHQNPHQVMKLFCYTHIPKFITLSATLDTLDPFMTKIYELMYPREERYNGDYYDVYIEVCAIKYQLQRPKALRWKGFGGAYSHTAYEASLMTAKNKVELKNYLDLIHWAAKEKFTDKMAKGQKMLIFCGTVKFCTLVQKYLQAKFKNLKIGRYVSGDKMSVFDECDIVISTVLSAGTAVDIKNLRIGLMTTAINSQQSNEQTLGRTRRLKDFPDITPQFFYFVSTSIDKHVRYHQAKQEAFKGKVLYHGEEQAPISV